MEIFKWTSFSGQKYIFCCRIILFPNVLNNNLNKCWVITKLSVCMSVIQHNVPVKLNPHSSGAALTYLSEVLEELRSRIRGSIKAREESRAAIIGERPDCPSSFPPLPLLLITPSLIRTRRWKLESPSLAEVCFRLLLKTSRD